ncbi:MAG: hypothetical protein IJA58_07495 [Lachnospiraceae bacterium]|nr:hypothetical protein [Lachnospiraceae bacterium]
MKKILIWCLALVLCLSMTACLSEDKETGKNENQSSEAAGDSATDKALALYEKYKDLLEMLEKENYQGAISHLAGIVADKNKQEQGDAPSLLKEMYGEWYLYKQNSGENAVAIVSFEDDGTCRLGDKELSWVISGENEKSVTLKIYEDGESRYSATMSLSDYSNQLCVSLYDSKDSKNNGTYYHHSIFNLMGGWWKQLDTTEEVKDNSFNLYPRNQVSFADVAYKQNLITYDDECVELTLYLDNVKKPAYYLTLRFRDGYPLMEVQDYESGAVTLYYRDESGRVDTWPEVLYSRAVKALKDTADGYGTWIEWPEEKSLTHNETLAYALDLFKQCGDYKDSKERVTKFTILENKLVEINEVRVDNLGNVSNNDYATYKYDKWNNRYYTSDYESNRLYFGKKENRTRFEYEFNGTGQITKIYQGSPTSASAIMTPEYDADGNMISLRVQTNSGEYTNYFTYEAGKLVSAKYYTVDSPEEVMHYRDFVYDGAGRLIEESGYLDWRYDYRCTYTYDNDGNLIEENYEFKYEYSDTTETEKRVHTYDSEGNRVSSTIEEGPKSNYQSRELSYVYETLYFYEFDAE